MDHHKLWKILKEMGIPDHLTCLLRNLYADKAATVITGHGTTDWFQIGKGVSQGCILSPCLLNLYAEYIRRNGELDEAQTGIKIVGHTHTCMHTYIDGVLWGLSCKESACQCRRCAFSLWVQKIPWRKKWQLTSVYLPGESHGQRRLAGYSPCGCKSVGHY